MLAIQGTKPMSFVQVTLCLDHPSISRLHALIVHHPRLNSYFLIDCGSQHGTFLDGKVSF